MIKNKNYLFENDFKRDSLISQYSLNPLYLNQKMDPCTPVDMTSNVSENFEIIDIKGNDAVASQDAYKLFYHKRNLEGNFYTLNFGRIYNRDPFYITVLFKQKKCLKYLKFKSINISKDLKIMLYGSNDNYLWEHIDTQYARTQNNLLWQNIYNDETQNISNYLTNFLYMDNSGQNHGYLNGNPFVFLKFYNESYYSYYKITIAAYDDYYNHTQNFTLSRMSLYDIQTSINPLFHFPLISDLNDVNHEIISTSQNVETIQNEGSIFTENRYSFLTYKKYFLYGMKQATLNFFVKFPTEEQIINDFNEQFSGTIVSKTKSVFNLYVFYQNNKLNFIIYLNSVMYSFNISYSEIENIWNHFSFVFEQKKTIFYLNGKNVMEMNNSNYVFKNDYSNDFQIGSEITGKNQSNIDIRQNYITKMEIKRLSVYDRNLKKEQIDRQMRKWK